MAITSSTVTAIITIADGHVRCKTVPCHCRHSQLQFG